MQVKIAIIGGSGLYNMADLENLKEIEVDTPFGKPSDAIRVGDLDGQSLVFLPRHGVGHRLLPSEINFRANVYALKNLGVEQIISVSAVGSEKEEIAPRHFVVPDQIYDRTCGRANTFFGEGIAAHVSLDYPFCPALSSSLHEVGATLATIHKGGTYICMEGPAFSSKAETMVYRRLGFDIIGMTAATEAKLAREAEICYAVLACVTDYDCWHPDHDNVNADMVLSNLVANVETSQRIVRKAVAGISSHPRTCRCATALEGAFATTPAKISAAARERLRPIISKYIY